MLNSLNERSVKERGVDDPDVLPEYYTIVMHGLKMKYCTLIIFSGSAQHAAVNGQFDII